MTPDDYIEALIAREGDYTNDPNDRGGPTRWGITEREARINGYTGDMRDLPRDTAKAIYFARYWVAPNFFQVAEINERIAAELLDTAVNMGVGTAVDFLQRALNVLNNMGKWYADIARDDHIGSETLNALRAYLKERGEDGVLVMLRALNALQGARYIELAEANPTQETFVYGWLLNRVS